MSVSDQALNMFAAKKIVVMTVREKRAINAKAKVRIRGQVIKKLFEWGYMAGHAYMLELKRDFERAPIAKSTLKILGKLVWHLFSHVDPEVKVEEKSAEEGRIYVLRVRGGGLSWDEEESRGVAYYLAGAYEGLGNTYAVIASDGGWRVYARPICPGDIGCSHVELVHIYAPAYVSEDEIASSFPGLFDELPVEYSDKLYAKILG